MAQFHTRLAKQPRRRLPWTSRKRLHFLNSLQGPGCLAKAGLCLPGLAGFWLSKKEVWLASGWLLADFLVGHPGGLVKALPLPQTKQSRWHNSTRGLAKQPRRRSPWTSRKRLHFLHSLQGPASLAKSALSCLVWLASGYQKKRLLAGFWLAFWLDIVRTWLKLAGFPRCLGAALWRHCPSHKRSKVDGTIPRVGLRSRSRLGRPEKGCTSLTPCKAQAALPNQPSLACFGWLLAIKKRGLVGFWLASGWLSGWTYRTYLAETGAPRCLGAALWRHCPSHKRSKVDGTIPRVGLRSSPGVDHFGRPEKGCTSLTLSCLVWLASGYQKKRFGWLLAGFWLASGWLSCWTCPCLEKSRTYLAETGWTSPLPGGGLVEALPLPQTKQSRWHNSTRGLAKQPRCQSRPSRKRLHFLNSLQGPGCLAKSALSCLLWLASGYQKKRLASGWLLAGFLVGHPPAWKNLVLAWLAYLAETGWTSPLPGGGLVEALPLPQTKQVGLRSSPGVDRLGRPEKGCTSLTPCKAALRNQASASLVGHPPA